MWTGGRRFHLSGRKQGAVLHLAEALLQRPKPGKLLPASVKSRQFLFRKGVLGQPVTVRPHQLDVHPYRSVIGQGAQGIPAAVGNGEPISAFPGKLRLTPGTSLQPGQFLPAPQQPDRCRQQRAAQFPSVFSPDPLDHCHSFTSKNSAAHSCGGTDPFFIPPS